MTTIETKDLWEGAFIIINGGQIEATKLDHSRGRREVILVLSGNNLEKSVREYQSGHIARFRRCLNHLRDLVSTRYY